MSEAYRWLVVLAICIVMALLMMFLNLKAGSNLLKRFTYTLLWLALLGGVATVIKVVLVVIYT
jgi:hypothetical protein